MIKCILLIVSIVLQGCLYNTSSGLQKDRLNIAISVAKRNSCAKWLKNYDSNLAVYDMSSMSLKEAVEKLNSCDALLLSGGLDVHPRNYGKNYDTLRCNIDAKRDTLEFQLIKIALDRKMPILGICRGEQILNVALGGSLVVDIPDDIGKKVIHKIKDSVAYHKIKLDNGFLKDLIMQDEGIVNSVHHQSVGKVSDSLKIVARTEDGVVEGYEWKNKFGKQFLLGLQWHPEKLDYQSPFSKPIALEFLRSAKKFKKDNIK